MVHSQSYFAVCTLFFWTCIYFWEFTNSVFWDFVCLTPSFPPTTLSPIALPFTTPPFFTYNYHLAPSLGPNDSWLTFNSLLVANCLHEVLLLPPCKGFLLLVIYYQLSIVYTMDSEYWAWWIDCLAKGMIGCQRLLHIFLDLTMKIFSLAWIASTIFFLSMVAVRHWSFH